MMIRPATAADLPGILEIYNDAVLNTTASYEYEPKKLADREQWLTEHQQENYPVLVAVDDDQRVLGWGSLSRFHPRIGYRFTVENSVYVAASQRGKGIGKELLRALIDIARERGFRAILALIDADNASSIRLHAHLGFTQVGHLKKVGYKFNRWLDVVYMELLL